MTQTAATITFTFAIALASLGLAAGSGSARAAEQLEHLVKTVPYSDLKPETEDGAAKLYARLRSAAKEVCAPLESREIGRRNIWQACYESALNSAVADVNKSTVTALHQQFRDHSSHG